MQCQVDQVGWNCGNVVLTVGSTIVGNDCLQDAVALLLGLVQIGFATVGSQRTVNVGPRGVVRNSRHNPSIS